MRKHTVLCIACLNVGPTVDLEYFDPIIECMFLCILGIPEPKPLVVQFVNPRYFLNRLGCYSARRWPAHIYSYQNVYFKLSLVFAMDFIHFHKRWYLISVYL